ncbi:hypothetical protein ACFL6C_13230 [Myxococcota bacterium]
MVRQTALAILLSTSVGCGNATQSPPGLDGGAIDSGDDGDTSGDTLAPGDGSCPESLFELALERCQSTAASPVTVGDVSSSCSECTPVTPSGEGILILPVQMCTMPCESDSDCAPQPPWVDPLQCTHISDGCFCY